MFWSVLHLVLFLALIMLWVRMIVDWVHAYARRWRPAGMVAVGLEVVYTVTDPPVKLVRKLIPPLPLGGIRVDLGFMVLLLAVYVLLRLVPVR